VTAFDNALKALYDPQRMLAIVRDAEVRPLKANTAILGGYYQLSIALGWFLHGNRPPVNATFPTFAAWSAQSLRADVDEDDEADEHGDDDDATPFHYPPEPGGLWPARRIYDFVTRAVMTDRGAIARNIALGQATIFEEVGNATWLLLKVALEAIDHGPVDWDKAWERYTEGLFALREEIEESRRQRGAASRMLAEDVPVLSYAIEPYFQLIKHSHELTTKERSQRILLGNIRLVAYEQRRLQPVLERNLELLPNALRLRVVTEWFGRDNLSTRAATRAFKFAQPMIPHVEEGFQIAATRHVYRMTVGQELLRFGVDLPLPPPAHPLLRHEQPVEDQDRYAEGDCFPYDLQTLDYPPLWSEWQHHDRSFGQGEQTAVDNWLRLPERLNFIVNLFRSRQQLCALYTPPAATPLPPPTPPVLGPVRVQHLADDTRTQLESFGTDAAQRFRSES
jgi:hypothetical protein